MLITVSKKTGFQKNKLFYTQGDYGLFQSSLPCHDETYDNEAIIRKMIESQGFTIDSQNNLILEKKRFFKDAYTY